MTNFEALNNMVAEFDKLCETAKHENLEIKDRIREKKEDRYMSLCTWLYPYLEFYRNNNLAEFDVPLCDADEIYYGKRVVVSFYAKECYLSFRNKRSNLRSMNCITTGGEFRPYEAGYMGIVDFVAKKWTEYSDQFESDFYKAVHNELTKKAKLLNDAHDQLINELENA